MARLHTKRHGKAKSRKPMPENSEAPQMKGADIEKLIVDYSKQGMKPAMIGETLKRKHSIKYPKQALGKRMGKVLEDNDVHSTIPYDMLDLMSKAVNMHKHMDSNKQDIHNRIRLGRIEAKIWRLTKYYIRTGKLPAGWRYNAKQAELIIRGRA